ncbi:MAG: rhodanese-like domain-containing protein [Thiovulaceae bacterium]|nr:rhodanese-like domain-containing protein [Sulfurimonadaceae bacterium]
MKNSIVNNGSFKTISTDDFLDKMEEGVTIIDVRRQDEWDHFGVIEGSHKITFFDQWGQHNIPGFMEEFSKVVTSKDQPFILVCAHANRTKSIGEFLGAKMGYQHVYELDGGINYGWIDKGYSTVRE